METTKIDISNYPCLETLLWEHATSIDITKNPKLKRLFCDYSSFEKIDLSKSIELEVLHIRMSKIKNLNLSKCKRIRDVDCSLCRNLKKIAVSNDSNPEIINYSDSPVDERSIKYIDIALNNISLKI